MPDFWHHMSFGQFICLLLVIGAIGEMIILAIRGRD